MNAQNKKWTFSPSGKLSMHALVFSCCNLLLIIIANSSDQDQVRQNVWPYLDPNCLPMAQCSLLSNATVGALIRNVGPSESMIRLSFNMAAASHTWFRNKEF